MRIKTRGEDTPMNTITKTICSAVEWALSLIRGICPTMSVDKTAYHSKSSNP